MQTFAQLYDTLEQSSDNHDQVAAMAAYFQQVSPEEGAWAVYLLTGRRLKRLATAAQLRAWLLDVADLPAWLVEACYAQVGDWAECIGLLLGQEEALEPLSLHHWIEERILPLAHQDEALRRVTVTAWWRQLGPQEVFVLNKLLGGGLRVGVSQALVQRALAQCTGLDAALIAWRLAGDWQPKGGFFLNLKVAPAKAEENALPYAFCVAATLEVPPLGDTADWQVEWQWQGVRVQLLHRHDNPQLWSQEDALLSEHFPEILSAARKLTHSCVLDGEILPWQDGIRPPVELQRRLNHKHPTTSLMARSPVILWVYDLLELDGVDWRGQPLWRRRKGLEGLLQNAPAPLHLPPLLTGGDWPSVARQRHKARQQGAEGLLLRHQHATYGVGEQPGDWWQWQPTPYRVAAVLLYAHVGHGPQRLTEYTLGVWQGEQLVPLAKVQAGLSDTETQCLDRWIRQHTVERFGPVRVVEPAQVFELVFTAVYPSRRHKSGVSLEAPRMQRWQRDKPAAEAASLPMIKALLVVDGY